MYGGNLSHPDTGSHLSVLGTPEKNPTYSAESPRSLDSSSPKGAATIACEACGKLFQSKGALGMHYKSHVIEMTNSEQEIVSVKCKACERTCKDRSTFVTHLQNCPKKEFFRQKPVESSFCCLFCNTHFEQKCAFISHLKTHYVEIVKSNLCVGVRCKHCDSEFKEKASYMGHIEMCAGRGGKEVGKKLKCKHAGCQNLSFQSRSNLLRHYSLFHGRKAPTTFKSIAGVKGTKKVSQNVSEFRCSKCRKMFATHSEWVHHKITKHVYYCGSCGMKFDQRFKLDEHLTEEGHSYARSEVPTYSHACKLCNSCFASREAFSRHIVYCANLMKKKRDENPQSDSTPLKSKSKAKSTGDELSSSNNMKDGISQKETHTTFVCNMCNKNFSSKKNLSRHVAVCSKNNKILENGKLDEKHNDSYESKPDLKNGEVHDVKNGEVEEEASNEECYTCEHCNEEFKTEKLLIKHKFYCLERIFACSACGKVCMTSEGFIKHKHRHAECVSVEDMHVQESHACGACNMSFSSVTKVTIHANQCHKGEARDKATGMYSNFMRQCQTCQEVFSVKDTPYHHHMWLAHGVKTKGFTAYFKCSVCYKRYMDLREFEVHEDTHAESKYRYACTMCDDKFKRKLMLEKHVREKHSD